MDINKGDVIYARPGISAAYYSQPDPSKRAGYLDAINVEIPPVLGSFTGAVKKNVNLEYLEISSVVNVTTSNPSPQIVYITTHDFDEYWLREAKVTATAPPSTTPGTEPSLEDILAGYPGTGTPDTGTVINPYDRLDYSLGSNGSNITSNTQWLIYALVAVSVIGLITVIVRTQFKD